MNLPKDTNPDHYKVGDADFIAYMDDAKINGFGNWMFANGYNVGLMSGEENGIYKVKRKCADCDQWEACLFGKQSCKNVVMLYKE